MSGLIQWEDEQKGDLRERKRQRDIDKERQLSSLGCHALGSVCTIGLAEKSAE